jgi:hypothetical protein
VSQGAGSSVMAASPFGFRLDVLHGRRQAGIGLLWDPGRPEKHRWAVVVLEASLITEAVLVDAVAHVVHDYANLVSSGTMAVQGHHKGQLLVPPMNTHVEQAFLLNCRKMGDFFLPPGSTHKDDITAAHFLCSEVTFHLRDWSHLRTAMHRQLMHISAARVEDPLPWDGRAWDLLLLAEFKSAWALFRQNVREPFASRFDEAVSERLDSEFAGTDVL